MLQINYKTFSVLFGGLATVLPTKRRDVLIFFLVKRCFWLFLVAFPASASFCIFLCVFSCNPGWGQKRELGHYNLTHMQDAQCTFPIEASNVIRYKELTLYTSEDCWVVALYKFKVCYSYNIGRFLQWQAEKSFHRHPKIWRKVNKYPLTNHLEMLIKQYMCTCGPKRSGHTHLSENSIYVESSKCKSFKVSLTIQ